MCGFCSSRYLRFPDLRHQTLLRARLCFLTLFCMEHNAYEFRQLVRQIICNAHSFPRTGYWFDLCDLYRLCYLEAFQGINVMGSRREGCRSDEEPISHLGFLQNLTQKLHGERRAASFPSKRYRSHQGCSYLSIPSILFHYKKYWSGLYRFFPRILQYLSRYTLLACQTPVLVCQSPAVSGSAGNFCSNNYSTGGGALALIP